MARERTHRNFHARGKIGYLNGRRTKLFDDRFLNRPASLTPTPTNSTLTPGMELHPIAKYRIIDRYLTLLLFET
jgi:hypothetical protein